MCLCLCVCVTESVGTGRNRKPREAFTLEEFPACKMCIAGFSTVKGKRERGEEKESLLCV